MIEKTNGLTPIDASQLLIGLYETHYGIFDHTDSQKAKENPLALVTLHECEENSSTSNIHELVNTFITKEIYKNLGISLTEFLSLPREFVNLLINSLTIKLNKESSIVSTLEQINKKT